MFSKWFTGLPLKITSVLIGIVLWFIVLGSRNVEITKDVPIEITTPADLTIVNEVTDRVSFRLSGPKAFLRNLLNRKEDPIRINLTNSKAGPVIYRFYQDNIQVPLGVKVLAINPTSVSIRLEPLKKKEVSVKLITHGELQAGYRLSKLELIRKVVRLRGAESFLNTLSEVPTVPFDLSQIQSSGEQEIALDFSKLHLVGGVNPPKLWLDGEVPRVRYDLIHITANYKIRNADIKVLTNRRFSIKPKEVNLYVKCSAEDLKHLDRSKVFGVVDLRNKGAGTYEIAVTAQLPDKIKIIKLLPAKVKVTLH